MANRQRGLSVKITQDTDKAFTQAMRKFKRKVNDDNVLREYRERQEFIKPSAKRKKAKAAAKKRHERKVASDQRSQRKY